MVNLLVVTNVPWLGKMLTFGAVGWRVDKNSLYQPPLQIILVCSSCYNKNTIDWVDLQQTFISHSSGGWEVQDQGAGKSGVWWGPTSWIVDSASLLYPHMAEREREREREREADRELESSLIRALIPFIKTPPAKPNYLPKAPTPNTIKLWGRVRASTFEFQGDTSTVHSTDL